MTNRRARFLVCIVAAGTLLVTSCERPERPEYTRFEQIPTEGWDPIDVIEFNPWPADSTMVRGSKYDMQLIFRFSARCPDSDIPVALTVEDYDGVLSSDTLIISESSKMSKTRMKYGVREVSMPLFQSVTLSEGYTISLSPLVARDYTEGLLNVGVVMTRH